ncbi:MAG: hypothetical protein U9Q23_04035 [Candidatus Bipolaricaulota bacterium]|nr:hypothetical protein [Candidatus Bipolaricaulota bacterium]
MKRWGVVLILFLLGINVCIIGVAENAGRLAAETGLDTDLFTELTVQIGGSNLSIVAVYINERALDSKISPGLEAMLTPHIDDNAIVIWASAKEDLPFDPLTISVEQSDKVFLFAERSNWVELPPGGFFAGGVAAEQDSAGLLIMGDRIDPTKPFWIVYQGTRGQLDIGPVEPTPTPAVQQRPQIREEPVLESVTDLEAELTYGDFSVETVFPLFGLSPSLVGTIINKGDDEELRLLLVRLEEGIEEGTLDPQLLASIEPFIGAGAVMVWALSPTGAEFSPWDLSIKQAETNYIFNPFSSSSFTGLTPGFSEPGFIEAGNITAGVVFLHRGIDPGAPFSICYKGECAAFPQSTDK